MAEKQNGTAGGGVTWKVIACAFGSVISILLMAMLAALQRAHTDTQAQLRSHHELFGHPPLQAVVQRNVEDLQEHRRLLSEISVKVAKIAAIMEHWAREKDINIETKG